MKNILRVFLHRTVGMLLLAVCAHAFSAAADSLTIGVRNEPTSMDPQGLWGFSNSQAYYHYLGYLLRVDPKGGVQPALAESWSRDGDNVWLFKLAPTVKFSDGSPLTAADVIASYQRAMTAPTSGYKGLFALVDHFEAPDPHTLKIVTRAPYPTLLYTLAQMPVLPKALLDKATPKDFGNPAFLVSAGPYVMTDYEPGAKMVFKPNPHYNGPKPHWDSVTLRFMSEAPARVAALLSGQVDMIDGVLPDDAAAIAKRAGFKVVSGKSGRMVYFAMNQAANVLPDATGPDGKPLATNPFRDVRVRHAIAIAIDRNAIVDRVLGGHGGALDQLGVAGQGGFDPSIAPIPYDPAQAKALLAQAGYPNGFSVTLTCPNGWLVNDSRVCQAIGQMLGRVGIKTAIDSQPWTAMVTRVVCHCDRRPSLFMTTWNSAYAGEVGAMLTNGVHSYDKSTGKGSWNQGDYPSTPALDALIDRASTTLDNTARFKLEAEAMRTAMADYPVIPVYYQDVTLASRKGITPVPATIEYTFSEYVSKDAKP